MVHAETGTGNIEVVGHIFLGVQKYVLYRTLPHTSSSPLEMMCHAVCKCVSTIARPLQAQECQTFPSGTFEFYGA